MPWYIHIIHIVYVIAPSHSSAQANLKSELSSLPRAERLVLSRYRSLGEKSEHKSCFSLTLLF